MAFFRRSLMTENAVLQLRAERIARATRPFLARGNRVRRCQRCLLPEKLCLCSTITPAQAKSHFCLLMFDTEPMKPSNTGRLIADILLIPLRFNGRVPNPRKICWIWCKTQTISQWWSFPLRMLMSNGK